MRVEMLASDVARPKAIAPEITPLAKSEMRYRRLFETAQDGILILDLPGGEIQDVNPFLMNLLGYTREEFVGKQLWEIGATIDKEAAIAAFARLKIDGYISYDDLPLRKKDGKIISVEYVSNIYKVANDSVIQCNIRDISDRKDAETKSQDYQNSIAISMHEMVDTLTSLMGQKDPYTAGHEARVSNLAVKIAKELNLPQHFIEGICVSAMLHDIGKVAIPAEVLTKPTKLHDFEMAMLRNHAQEGYDILNHVHFPWPVAQIALQHHERLDGSGYPNGLKGDSICMEARIVAVADCVEAMAGDRPYRKAVGIDAALKMIEENQGKLFDSEIVQACIKLFREDKYEFPVRK